MRVQQGVRAEAVEQGAEHVLWVEGDKDSLDPEVLGSLFKGAIRVRPLGRSHELRAVASAWHRHSPRWYFLVNRDHRTDAQVEALWSAFPDPNTHNLLCWRKRELENHFLDPALLHGHRALRPGADLDATLESLGRRHVFRAAANMVIQQVREEQKSSWVQGFRQELTSADEARQALLALPAWGARAASVPDALRPDRLAACFDEALTRLTDGQEPPRVGRGAWLESSPAATCCPSW